MTFLDRLTSTVRPIAGDHAIEAMAIAVEWAQPNGVRLIPAFDDIYQASNYIKAFLPERREITGLQVQFSGDAGGTSISPSASKLVDYVRKKSESEFEWAVGIRPDFISCTCTTYSGWKAAKETALSLLIPFVEVAEKSGVGLSAVGLQYFDAFVLEASNHQALTNVLRQNASLLPSRVFSHDSLWHVYQGWFSSASRDRRILNNVNIELQDTGNDRMLKVNGQHRLQAVTLDGKTPIGISLDDFSPICDELHNANKDVLHDILTDAMLQRIGMKTE